MLKKVLLLIFTTIVGFAIGLMFNGHYFVFDVTVYGSPINYFSEYQLENIILEDPSSFQTWTSFLWSNQELFRVEGSWIIWVSLFFWTAVSIALGFLLWPFVYEKGENLARMTLFPDFSGVKKDFIMLVTGWSIWGFFIGVKKDFIMLVTGWSIWGFFILALKAMRVLDIYDEELLAWLIFPPPIVYIGYLWVKKYVLPKSS